MLYLFTGIYQDMNPARAAEYEEAEERNEKLFDYYRLEDENEHRLTFYEWFKLAEKECNAAAPIAVIANADIAFDETINLVKQIGNWDKVFISLSRQDQKVHSLWSQDVWIFKPPLPNPTAWEKANFTMGIPGCENRLCAIARTAGMKIYNPCLSIMAHHLHASGVRHWKDSDRLRGDMCRADACSIDALLPKSTFKARA